MRRVVDELFADLKGDYVFNFLDDLCILHLPKSTGFNYGRCWVG